eukprot:CCRYP_003075-RA/>CCRYP_003075-RA protein AED:0.33 eAED:0.33 QI:0/-1/0/1/-1/1/1/0/288
MMAYPFLLSTAILFCVAHADRWYVNWEDLTCVDDANMPHWSMVYGSKEECCEKVFWWKQYECEVTLSPTKMPSSAPTKLRGSPSGQDGRGNGSGIEDTSNAGNGGSMNNAGSAGNKGNDANSGDASRPAVKVWLTAVGDTYIRNDRPFKNYGNKKALKVGTDGETVTLIKFDLKRVRKNLGCVRSATLSLYPLVKSRNGGGITTFDSNVFSQEENWEEATINWRNAPQERSYTFQEIGPVREKKWIDIDVTKELGNVRFRTFLIVGGTFAKYASKESRHPPSLSIDLC